MSDAVVRIKDPRLDFTRGREGFIAFEGAQNWEF